MSKCEAILCDVCNKVSHEWTCEEADRGFWTTLVVDDSDIGFPFVNDEERLEDGEVHICDLCKDKLKIREAGNFDSVFVSDFLSILRKVAGTEKAWM